jgi:hypothetical protein
MWRQESLYIHIIEIQSMWTSSDVLVFKIMVIIIVFDIHLWWNTMDLHKLCLSKNYIQIYNLGLGWEHAFNVLVLYMHIILLIKYFYKLITICIWTVMNSDEHWNYYLVMLNTEFKTLLCYAQLCINTVTYNSIAGQFVQFHMPRKWIGKMNLVSIIQLRFVKLRYPVVLGF